MSRRTRCPLALSVCLLGSAAPVGAQGAERWVSSCPAGEWSAARTALASLDRQVHQAKPGSSDLEGLQAALKQLLAGPCFATAAESSRRPAFVTLTTARAWWHGGGRSWLEAQGPAARDSVFAADEPAALTLETAPADDPLRGLSCSERDASCGASTRAWRARALRAFRRHAEREASRRAAPPSASVLRACAADARARATEERYAYWYACVEGALPRVGSLPLGGLRAPEEGWFVLRGRRGHHEFCDELRAYDLATGAAHVAQRCGRLALAADGSVDAAQTSASSRTRSFSGRLPLAALREAAWMTLLADRVEPQLTRVEYLRRPPDFPRRWPSDKGFGAGVSGHARSSSGETRLEWTWIHGSHVRLRGTLEWPDSDAPGEAHASALWREAEARLERSCLRRALPDEVLVSPEPLAGSAIPALDLELAQSLKQVAPCAAAAGP